MSEDRNIEEEPIEVRLVKKVEELKKMRKEPAEVLLKRKLEELEKMLPPTEVLIKKWKRLIKEISESKSSFIPPPWVTKIEKRR